MQKDVNFPVGQIGAVLESWQEKTSAQGREALDVVFLWEKSHGKIWNTSMIFRETSINEWMNMDEYGFV